jgi:hypothetical protein
MILCDENVIKAHWYFERKDEFYTDLRTFFWAFLFQSRAISCYVLSLMPRLAKSKIAAEAMRALDKYF